MNSIYLGITRFKSAIIAAFVFRVLGLLGRAEKGISLEEILIQIGLSRVLKKQYTKRFREKYTNLGQIDSIQGYNI